MLNYGFTVLALNCIFAEHFTRNSASGRMLQKLGMRHEGRVSRYVAKWDRFEDREVYGILLAEFPAD